MLPNLRVDQIHVLGLFDNYHKLGFPESLIHVVMYRFLELHYDCSVTALKFFFIGL